MEKIEFVKMNPNKNATIIVLNDYPREKYVLLSKELMRMESVYGEQVGFVETSTDPQAYCRLHMMGGEFCANAVASLCSYLAYEENVKVGEKKQCKIEVSGSENLIECETRRLSKGYRARITMPLPSEIREESITYGGQNIKFGIVEYSGVCQGIVHDEQQGEQSKTLAHYILHHGLAEGYATKGVTLFSNKSQSISPLIFVKETNTEIWENSCGIASASLAAYQAYKQREDITLNIAQPSGDYVCAQATYDNGFIQRVTIEEDVFLSAMGTAFI
ncbi:conserved hypothetical protein [Alkaliphilus metalliredigens QYMF]|uniref:Diaminopimelate epimerase n=1 Tax=Alkaliphilus metalliredigens (strain QYMF) TaxID=293826 RepID=A6TPU3_ALKMQ|nr:hypothetical protein [Alkaliphilus metalliredigens]ABR48211.1 conserved hypothetical protein [Alkaliphilus metalliredigens QYMF]